MFDKELKKVQVEYAANSSQQSVPTAMQQQSSRLALNGYGVSSAQFSSAVGQPIMATLSSVGDRVQPHVVQHQILGANGNPALLQTYQVSSIHHFTDVHSNLEILSAFVVYLGVVV